MRIRSRLLVLVFSMLIPSVIGAGLGIYYVYEEQQDSYRKSIADLSNAMALLLDKEMSERAHTLNTLAQSPSITDHSLVAFYRFAKEVASGWNAAIVLSDPTGQQLLNTRVAFGTSALPQITPSLLTRRQLHRPEAPGVSDVYYSPIGKGHSFAVEVPVMRDGRILYYVAMVSFTGQLQRLFEQQKMPAGWIATILDSEGIVAARSHNPGKFVGVVADEALRKKIAAHPAGTNDGTTFDGTPVTAFFSRAPASGWSFVVSVPRDSLRAPARDATAVAAGIALLLLGLGTAAAFVIARRTAKSMEDLRLAAADLGQDKLIARQSSGVAEVDAVSLEIARASERIRNAKAELEHRVADAVAVAEQSQKALLQSQKLEALGRLTGGIAHDFNNVMQTLTTGLQLLLFSSTEPRLKRTAEACHRAVARATELTRQLMAFGRVQDAHLATVDLALQAEELKPLLQGGLRGNIELHFDIAAELWSVTIDPTQFELAMLNVVINARDAIPDAGRITVSMRNVCLHESSSELGAGDYVQIAVADSGHGMPHEVLSKALDPFFTTKTVGRGSGMGLPQAYGFTKQAGGSLTIDSTPGEGTTTTFYLPRARGPVKLKPDIKPLISPRLVNKGSKVLFVEDDPLVSAVVAPALRASGFEVHQAKDGAEALYMMKHAGPFNVVFSDIVMPGQISGIDLAEYISKHAAHTRVVLATGYAEQRLELQGVEILGKPYDVEEVIEILSRE